MKRFCTNCGTPNEEGAVFCAACGAKLSPVQPTQTAQPAQPARTTQSTQPTRPVVTAQPVQQTAYPYGSQPPQKKKKGWLVALIIAGAVITVMAVVIVLLVVALRAQPADNTEPTQATLAVEATEDVPDFEAYGIVPDLSVGDTFDYVTGLKDSDTEITAKVTLRSFTREAVTDELLDFGSDNSFDLSGYEKLQVSFRGVFPSSAMTDTNRFNAYIIRTFTDYYHIDRFDDSFEILTDTEGGEYYRAEVEIDGAVQDIYCWANPSAEYDGDQLIYIDERTFYVPAGYDGLICGWKDGRLSTEAHIYEDYTESAYHILRLQGGDLPAPTEKPTEKATEKPAATEAAQSSAVEPQSQLPYMSLGKPSATDFAWIADAQSGNLSGTTMGKDDFVGRWKAEYVFDGVWELVRITIDTDGTVSVEPCQVNYGDGWVDETDESTYGLTGKFNVGGAGNIVASGSYGTMELYEFVQSGGAQYGVGNFTVQSGETAKVYLVRP